MKKSTILWVLPLFTAACTTTIKPLTEADIKAANEKRLLQLTAGQEEVSSEISLYEAMARAIKYNLDYQIEAREKALRHRELKQVRYDMLPQLVASSGYLGRNNFSGATSVRIAPDGESLIDGISGVTVPASTSSERETFNDELSLSWDVLDFGLSYIRAKQKGDEILIAEEQRRKVINRIIEDVRTAYWRAVSAERLISDLNALEADINQALSSSEKVYERGNVAPMSALTYQRELLKIKEEILTLQKELGVAKHQLASLMNLRPDEKYKLVMPNRDETNLEFTATPEKMIETALYYRPEMRENLYRERINKGEVSAALLDLLPGIRVYGGLNYDSNEFLFNDSWRNWGARASWNLMEVFRYPTRKKTVEAQQALIEQQSLALTMAVMTQVYVSVARFEVAKRSVANTQDYHNVQTKILNQINAGFKSNRISRQTLIREKMNKIVADAKYDIALADLQNAFANIHASIGLPPYGDDVTGFESVTELTAKLEKHWQTRGDKLTSRHFDQKVVSR